MKAEEFLRTSEYKHLQIQIIDENKNKWLICEWSDLPDVMEAYAKQNNIALIKFVWDSIYLNKMPEGRAEQLIKQFEDESHISKRPD